MWIIKQCNWKSLRPTQNRHLLPQLIFHVFTATILTNYQMSEYLSSSAPNAKPKKIMCCCRCASVISERRSRATAKPSFELGSVSEWETDSRSPGVPEQHCGLAHPFTPSPPLPLSSLFLLLSLRAVFPFDQIQAKTCRAIYSRVELFYLLVPICGTPEVQRASWLLTSAAQHCNEMVGIWETKRDRKNETEWQRDRQRGARGCMKFGYCLSICMMSLRGSGEGLFLYVRSLCKMILHSLCTCYSLFVYIIIVGGLYAENWVVGIRSPSRDAGLVEKRQPRSSLGKHHQQTQDTHWATSHKHIHIYTIYWHTYILHHTHHTLVICMYMQ